MKSKKFAFQFQFRMKSYGCSFFTSEYACSRRHHLRFHQLGPPRLCSVQSWAMAAGSQHPRNSPCGETVPAKEAAEEAQTRRRSRIANGRHCWTNASSRPAIPEYENLDIRRVRKHSGRSNAGASSDA